MIEIPSYNEIVKQYQTSRKLRKENFRLYKEIDRHIGLDKVFDLRTEIRNVMSQYQYRSTFTHMESYYYHLAKRYGISWGGVQYNTIKPNYCIYRWMFSDNRHVYIGLTTDINRRIGEELRLGTVHDYLIESGQHFSISILESGLYPSDAAEMERYYIVQSKLDGYIPINKATGGTLGACVRRSDEELLTLASKYKTVKDLCSDGALLKALKERPGLYRKATTNMIKLKRPQLSRETIAECISKCTTLVEFMRTYPSEYGVCKRNKWEDLMTNLKRSNVPSGEVTVESIKEALSQCSGRTEFNKRFRRESYVARKLGIYDELVKSMPKQTGKRK